MMDILSVFIKIKELFYKRFLLYFFSISMILRIFVVLNYNNELALNGSDKEHYQIAANLVNGNGYSWNYEEPYEITLYREPGYILFLASILKTREFFGYETQAIKTQNQFFGTWEPEINKSLLNNELKYIKIWQAIIDSFSVVFLVLLVSLIIKEKRKVIIFGLLLSVFFPTVWYITLIGRETFLTFLCSGFAYYFAKYLYNNNYKDLILFSVFLGLMIVTFQALLVFILIVLIYLLWFKHFINVLKTSLIVGVIVTLISLPWLFFAYKQYPDLRILKSWGSSLTHETNAYVNAHRNLFKLNKISKDSLVSISYVWGGTSPKEAFDRSFYGYYKNEVKRINSEIADEKLKLLKIKLKENIEQYAKVWFIVSPGKGKRELIRQRNFSFRSTIMLILLLLPGVVSFIGFLSNSKKLAPILFLFFTFYALTFMFEAGRRLQPIYSYILLFFVLQMFSIVEKIKNYIDWVRIKYKIS